ncbi:TetR family transcriptional regulator [Phytoactinopolyspora limicola]|uniref:TetR/AcrR family transcriptional regulator n=1 Tax=Phytoactinopolyspora limicola TaxID=2715536 RepID=UPI00140AF00E|nr:TetR family transcriptional regulator [Phytoactinopolyspora limicola]
MKEHPRRRGRPPGGQSSRGGILAAARAEFEEQGYNNATVRAIARRANVDPAMIHHYFGTKENLFLAAMDISVSPDELVESLAGGPREELGERAVRTFLRFWGDPRTRGPLLGLLRSAMTNEMAALLLRQFLARVVLSRVLVVFEDVPDGRLRAEALAAQLVGIGILRFVVKLEPIASASDEELIALVGPVVQGYLPEP